MKFEFFPGDIAAAIAKEAGETDPAIIDSATGALYELKAICENRYNSEFYRDFYKLLEKFTEVTQ